MAEPTPKQQYPIHALMVVPHVRKDCFKLTLGVYSEQGKFVPEISYGPVEWSLVDFIHRIVHQTYDARVTLVIGAGCCIPCEQMMSPATAQAAREKPEKPEKPIKFYVIKCGDTYLKRDDDRASMVRWVSTVEEATYWLTERTAQMFMKSWGKWCKAEIRGLKVVPVY